MQFHFEEQIKKFENSGLPHEEALRRARLTFGGMDQARREYHYLGHPVAALQALDSSGCVTCAGTFTKMLFNALRLGFMVLPEHL